MTNHAEILTLALVGLRSQAQKIQDRIAEIETMLNGTSASASTEETEQPKKKRKLSAKGRAAIVAATKKRWAKAKTAKRKLSPKQLKAMKANAAKARAARAAKAGV